MLTYESFNDAIFVFEDCPMKRSFLAWVFLIKKGFLKRPMVLRQPIQNEVEDLIVARGAYIVQKGVSTDPSAAKLVLPSHHAIAVLLIGGFLPCLLT